MYPSPQHVTTVGRPRTVRRLLTAAIAAVALTVSACGSGSSASETPTDPTSVSTSQQDDQAAGDSGDDTQPSDDTATGEGAEDDGPDTDGTPETGENAEQDAALLETLRIRHPQQLAFAAPFTLINDDGPLGDYTEALDVDVWASPDVLRGMLTSGQTDITAVPTYVGANLYNKDVDVQMVAVVVWGLLHVIGPEGTEASWESLRGQTIMLPFKNDMPDLVFQYLVRANGLVIGEDLQVEYYAQPTEVVARLASDKGSWAVMPDHTATLAITKAKKEGVNLMRVLDLQQEWGAATGTAPRIPQAGIVASSEFAQQHPDLIAALLDELTEAVSIVNAADEDTVALLAEANDLPAPVVADVIPRLNLSVVPADDARAELEAFYTELAELSPDIIGGQLPDDGFYLADPRK